MTSHQWLLKVDDTARKQIRKLPSSDRMAVFRSIAQLCTADNPYAAANVVKLREERYEGMYRRRQGDYRIFFDVETGEIEELSFAYKGILRIAQVVHRREAYR